MKKRVFLTFSMIVLAAAGFADSGSINTDDLFGESNDLISEEPVEETDSKDFTSELLTSDTGVSLSGKYFFSMTAGASWSDPSNVSLDTAVDTAKDSYDLDLGTSLVFDARPDEDMRVLGKVEIRYPFGYSSDERNFDDVFHVTELFSDFNIDDRVFFRAGKSTINWGVGYFFSPADLLNLSQIDPENPDDELEGPVSVKMNIPVGLNNLYVYVIAPEGIESASKLAVAPKIEFVTGNSEIGAGAYYQKDHSPAVMATVSTGINDLSLFLEGVVTYGSDKTFVDQDFSLITYDDTFFVKATAGGMYTWSDDLSNFDFSFTGQYLFNGEGYDDDDQVFLTENRQTVMAAVISEVPSYSALSLSDLMQTGRHYGAGSFNWKGMFQSDFDFSLFWLGNISDGSGMVKPSVSYKGFDNISITAGMSYNYGEAGDEYTPQGDMVSATIAVSMGGTSF